MNFLRGYGYQGGASRGNWSSSSEAYLAGEDLVKNAVKPGEWTMNLLGFGEVLPYHENKMYLNYSIVDKWGLPTVNFETEIKENEKLMRKDMADSAAEMLEECGFKDVQKYDNRYALGLGIHEMGTARMGHDKQTSVLNKYNQIHSVKNVFVTDGSCMTSSGNVNPSLTYMAITARAANHAVKELKKMNL